MQEIKSSNKETMVHTDEVHVACPCCKNKRLLGTYDFVAIIILIMIVFFAMCMAGFDMVLTNMPKNIWDKWW